MDLKIHFILNENKSGSRKQNIFLKIKNASQNIVRNFFVSEVFNKNVAFLCAFDDN
jgi:hypothetical protein